MSGAWVEIETIVSAVHHILAEAAISGALFEAMSKASNTSDSDSVPEVSCALAIHPCGARKLKGLRPSI